MMPTPATAQHTALLKTTMRSRVGSFLRRTGLAAVDDA